MVSICTTPTPSSGKWVDMVKQLHKGLWLISPSPELINLHIKEIKLQPFRIKGCKFLFKKTKNNLLEFVTPKNQHSLKHC